MQIYQRFSLFLFFSVMAWSSIFKPENGEEMVDDAAEGALLKARKKFVQEWKRNYND